VVLTRKSASFPSTPIHVELSFWETSFVDPPLLPVGKRRRGNHSLSSSLERRERA
jgi:hypothetical protein